MPALFVASCFLFLSFKMVQRLWSVPVYHSSCSLLGAICTIFCERKTHQDRPKARKKQLSWTHELQSLWINLLGLFLAHGTNSTQVKIFGKRVPSWHPVLTTFPSDSTDLNLLSATFTAHIFLNEIQNTGEHDTFYFLKMQHSWYVLFICDASSGATKSSVCVLQPSSSNQYTLP